MSSSTQRNLATIANHAQNKRQLVKGIIYQMTTKKLPAPKCMVLLVGENRSEFSKLEVEESKKAFQFHFLNSTEDIVILCKSVIFDMIVIAPSLYAWLEQTAFGDKIGEIRMLKLSAVIDTEMSKEHEGEAALTNET